ncbi:hypothetical protein [Lentilactobacillus hilgardii]|uniref:hypothetical protein n=1 Tax=Lentilactobacillus hilgardii TaxID=1588 RepID=UPI0021C3CDA2|nr:hypothetical protein [Lentilactobacillus hilgardii]
MDEISDENHIPEIMASLRELNHYLVEAGVLLDVGNKGLEFLQMIATVNEFGADITPIHGAWLTIPTKLGLHHKASDFGNKLFKPKGKNVLAMNNNNGGLDIYFILVKHVHTPERSFLRDGVDDYMWSIFDSVEDDLNRIMNRELTPRELYEHIGLKLKGYIKDNIVLKVNPSNAPLTIANKGKDDPLVDTGTMLRSISYRVIDT